MPEECHANILNVTARGFNTRNVTAARFPLWRWHHHLWEPRQCQRVEHHLWDCSTCCCGAGPGHIDLVRHRPGHIDVVRHRPGHAAFASLVTVRDPMEMMLTETVHPLETLQHHSRSYGFLVCRSWLGFTSSEPDTVAATVPLLVLLFSISRR